jgi:hypothetical protein
MPTVGPLCPSCDHRACQITDLDGLARVLSPVAVLPVDPDVLYGKVSSIANLLPTRDHAPVVDRVYFSVSSDWMVSKGPCRGQIGDRGCVIAQVGEDGPLIAVQPGAGAILWLEAAQAERRAYRADRAKGRVLFGRAGRSSLYRPPHRDPRP